MKRTQQIYRRKRPDLKNPPADSRDRGAKIGHARTGKGWGGDEGKRLLKISTTEAYEEEFFRRAFRSFNEDFLVR